MTRNLLLALLLLLPLPALAADEHAVIFMYHRFGEDRYPTTSITLDQFDAQLTYLKDNGYQVWPLARVVDHLQKNQPIPDHTIAITVDDAYLSVYQNGYPRLKALGWPFTVFVNTDPVDRHLPGFMSWEQMREMQANGVTFANHTATHDSMTKRLPGEDDTAWAARMRADIDKAQRRLQRELGAKTNSDPKLFVYPYGEYDTRAATLIREMGYIGFGQQSGAVGPLSDLRALPRYPMAEHFAALAPFARKAASLPLPVTAEQPWEPRVGDDNPPKLTVTLERPMRGVACYNADGEQLPIRWREGSKTQFEVQSPKPLAKGRNRYNCTAPARERGRWYWHSHPWLITTPAAAPVVTAPTDPAR